MEDLETLYNDIAAAIEKVDFGKLWDGFHPLKFALYNDTECFFDGRYVEKTTEFCANTAIEYQGDVIAIWHVMEEMDTAVFASKIIHEMFHAFQTKQGWDCWANEREAPFRYQYNAENLSLVFHENKLLLELLEENNTDKYHELLKSRRYRSQKFPYEFGYECSIEEIEGSATYVEWQVLKQLDSKKADEFVAEVRDFMKEPESLFPIRILGYYSGALLIHALIQNGDYFYGTKNRPVVKQVPIDMPEVTLGVVGNVTDANLVEEALSAYVSKTKQIVEKVKSDNDVVVAGPVELGALNIADARYDNGYLTSRFFVMYIEDGEQKIVNGNFVLKMKDEKIIDTVYRWNKETDSNEN